MCWSTGREPTAQPPGSDTFASRSSTGTYFDAQGKIQTAAVNAARMSYNPADLLAPPTLLQEAASTNMLTVSDFATPGGTSLLGDAAYSDFSGIGMVTGVKIGRPTVAQQWSLAYKTVTLQPNTSYCLSVFVKMDDGLVPVFRSDTAASESNDFALAIGDLDIERSLAHEGLGESPSRRVLLAEDNPVNQLVAVRTLERAGYKVTVANNGQEALDLLERESFDVVLMDVQMPVMGGIEATRAIRAREQRRSWVIDTDHVEHLPIIAMTANAMKGDRELCLDEGMDDYVSKPVKADDLLAALERVLARPDDSMSQTAITDVNGLMRERPDAADPVMDLEHTLATLEGDRAMVLRVIDVFLGELPELRRGLGVCVQAQDGGGAARICHRLRGSLSVFGAAGAEVSVTRLEDAARGGDLSDLATLHKDADQQLARLGDALSGGRTSVAAMV